MKNVHVIPTDKPSRLLYFGTSKELTLQINPATFRAFERSPQHIYITSDEEIKEGDWYIYLGQINKRTRKNPKAEYSFPNYKKIILTTDQDLIADGVQAIDDTFLEWFVKNPSCEEVEVEIETTSIQLPQQQLSENSYDLAFRWINKKVYKIIIPKEEPKQETIEEATKRLFSYEYGEETYVTDKKRDAFIEGAKWQQEQIKNESEQLINELESLVKDNNLGESYRAGIIASIWRMKEWFEQYKKK